MHTGRYMTGHDIVSLMFSLFSRKPVQNKLDLSKIQAILFDLDGTLVDVNMNRFVPSYLRRLTAYMSAHVNPAHAIQTLHHAVAAMFANTDASRTLESILLDVLDSELTVSPELYAACLEQLCQNDLEELRPLITGHP